MKSYQSNTTNGGKTVMLNSVEEAIEVGRKFINSQLAIYTKAMPSSTIITSVMQRDKPKELVKKTVAEYLESLKERSQDFEMCVHAILLGDSVLDQKIREKSEQLTELATAIEPSLAANYAGFERSEQGVAADVGLLASGDDRPFFQRQTAGPAAEKGHRGRAYRLLLNTDISWFGKPDDNASVVGALILCLQRFGPVELWIQQAWLGEDKDDGVTLFKLDFSQEFVPTQMAFWCGHELKDTSFSFEINMGLGRKSGGSAKSAELPADLFLRGDWMKVYGVTDDFHILLHTEKLDIMGKWIAETAMRIITSDDNNQGTDGFTF